MRITRVRIFYPADPVGIVPGGVDTFIRGIIKWAPQDIEFSLVGMTTAPAERPVRRWTRCSLGRREFDFFPAVHVADAGKRSFVPLSLTYTLATALALSSVKGDFDVFEFHRVEPALLFDADTRPKNAFFHQDMTVIRSEKADILWRYLPAVYEAIERKVVVKLASAWCVQRDGVRSLQVRYPEQADAIRFIPTWVDTEVFSPMVGRDRAERRENLAVKLNIDSAVPWIVSVGRLDTQKDPQLLLLSFARLVSGEGDVARLLLIGDGVLRAELEKRVVADGLSSQVRFLGLLAQREIAGILAVADVFALSSAYEGMPMAVLEALGSGLPVATTDVGEVRKVVFAGTNGAISVDHSVQAFAACLKNVLDNRASYRGLPATQAIEDFRPAEVLRPVYDTYRQLGLLGRSGLKQNEGHGVK